METVIPYSLENLDPEDLVAKIIQQILSGTRHNREISLSDCTLEDGCLYHHGKLWIPSDDSLRLRLVQEAHSQPMASHPGIAKTYEILQRDYYWPKMIESVRQYIRNCHTCSRAKPARDRQGELLPLSIPQRRWQDLAMDFIIDLPESSDACYPRSKHIWIITDRLTKERHFGPCADLSTSHLVRMFIQFVVRTHRLP